MDTVALNSLYEAFEKQALLDPERIVLVEPWRQTSARELLERINAIAAAIEPHQNIGVVLDHDRDLIASLFAINKQGSAFVPAEPDLPDQRIADMFSQAGVRQVLARKKDAERFERMQILDPDDLTESPESLPALGKPEDRAYILFTSGTTGRPKGVVVRNENVLNYATRAFQNEFHVTPEDRMLQNSVVSFDIFIEEVFGSLLNGATLVIAGKEEKQDIESLARFIEDQNITMISGFPYLLEEFNEARRFPETLRLMISGGDVLRLFQVDWLLDRVPVYNTYGPSETTVCATYFPVKKEAVLEDGTFPIGHPVANVEVEIRDENARRLPRGIKGEIWIGGAGVSSGYIQPVEESAHFITEDGKRLYQSGDLGWMDENGQLYFLSRKDRQVMIDGRRVEMAELENVLFNLEGIEQAAVLAYLDENKRTRLAAFYSGYPDPEAVEEWMKRYLTSYMIPSKILQLDQLPLNDHGKVDSAALRKEYGLYN